MSAIHFCFDGSNDSYGSCVGRRLIRCIIRGVLTLCVFTFAANAQSLTISGTLTSSGHPEIHFPSKSGFYYILYQGDSVVSVNSPAAFVLGDATPVTLRDNRAVTTASFYRVGQISVLSPLDTDDDGIDDVWELQHRLNPLDPKDALLSSGNEGSWLEVYKAERAPPTVSFAARSSIAREGQRSFSVGVVFSTPFVGTLPYATTGTAVLDADYSPATNNVMVDGTTATIPLLIRNEDFVLQEDRTIVLSLLPSAAGTPAFVLGGPRIHTVYLQDNDALWQGTLDIEGLKISFAMSLGQNGSTFQGTVNSDGSGSLPKGQWPVAVQATANQFNAAIGPILMPASSSLLGSEFARWIYLDAVPATNATHRVDLNLSIAGSVREEDVFSDVARQHLNRTGASAPSGTFVLQRASSNLARTQPTLSLLP